MKRLFQIFGGGLGWSLGGPIGALLGVAFGNMVHDLVHGEDEPNTQSRQGSSPSDFHISLLVLAARVIKADGKVEQSELDFVRQQFAGMFGKLFDDAGRPEDGKHPGMHVTETVDYAVVIDGEINAIMDEGETVLRKGDVLIQRGTNHAWTNRSGKPAKVAFVLIAGRFD